MLDMEARGAKTLDNYQNFAKAFKVRDFQAADGAARRPTKRGSRAPSSSARREMSEGSELHQSVLRAVLYAVMELVKNVDGNEVLAHLTLNVPDYYGDHDPARTRGRVGRLPREEARSPARPTRPAPRASCASW